MVTKDRPFFPTKVNDQASWELFDDIFEILPTEDCTPSFGALIKPGRHIDLNSATEARTFHQKYAQ